MAYTIHDEFQGLGLGRAYCKSKLTAYARRKGVPGFWALSFGSNKAMLSVLGKLGPYTKQVIEPGIGWVEHRFES